MLFDFFKDSTKGFFKEILVGVGELLLLIAYLLIPTAVAAALLQINYHVIDRDGDNMIKGYNGEDYLTSQLLDELIVEEDCSIYKIEVGGWAFQENEIYISIYETKEDYDEGDERVIYQFKYETYQLFNMMLKYEIGEYEYPINESVMTILIFFIYIIFIGYNNVREKFKLFKMEIEIANMHKEINLLKNKDNQNNQSETNCETQSDFFD